MCSSDLASTLDATTRRVLLTGGVLRGRGTIVASGAPGLRNGATVDVGAPGAIGSLAVTGSMTQTVDGTLLLDVGGSGATAHDLLTVSGAATLGGTLSLRLDPAWSPSEGDSVTIMTTGSHTGAFASITADRALPNGLGLAVDYSDPTTVRVNVVRTPDLSVALTGPTLVAKGSDASFVATVRNNGPVDATGVVVTFDRPTGTSFVAGSSSSGCTSGATTVTCTVGGLANGASLDLTVVLSTSATGTFTEHATVTSDTSDSVPINDTGSVTTQVAAPDLGVTLSGPATGSVGATLVYTATVTNNGPVDATGVTVTMARPANTTVIGAASSATCTTSTTITCSVGSLAPSATATVTIALQSSVGQTITASVLVGPTADDPVPANNTSNTVTTSITNADLSLTKLVPSPTSITIGGSTLVTGTVTNVGAGAANGVIYQLLIPSAWTFDASRTVVKDRKSTRLNSSH